MDSTPYVIPLSAQKPKILTLVPADPTSRYKTRQLQVQVVGKSKMIKTVLVNILDVAKDMQVPPSYIGTFMGYESAAQAKWDAAKPERQQAYISGEHDTKDLSRIMVQFVTEVVLCPVCGLPEILINFEGKKVVGKCRACGGNSELPITNEKFKRYVINHPPSATGKGGAFAGNKAGIKKDGKKTPDGKSKKKDAKKTGEEDEEEVEDNDGVVWYSDTSEEAAQKRKEEMVPKSLEEKQIETEIEEVVKVIHDATPDNISEKIKQLKTTLGFSDKIIASRVMGAILGTNIQDLQAEIKSNLHILKSVINSTEAQLSLLLFLENLCVINNLLAPKIALVLKDLYDNDLVEEEIFLKWFQGEINPIVKEKSGPFLKWLNEAEEESSGEENDED